MLDILKKRRSIREFTAEKVSEENKNQILKAGLLSPTGMGRRHIEFVTIENKEVIESLISYKKHGTRPLKTASLVIAVLGDTEVADTWIEDASLAVYSMQLEVTKLGLGSTWVQMRMRETLDDRLSNDALRELLGYPENIQALCLLAIGHPNEEKAAYEESFCDFSKVHSEKY